MVPPSISANAEGDADYPTADFLVGELLLWQKNAHAAEQQSEQLSGGAYGPLEACSSEAKGRVRYWLEWRIPLDEVDVTRAKPVLLPHTRARSMQRALEEAVRRQSSTMEFQLGCKRNPAPGCIAPTVLRAVTRVSAGVAWYITAFDDFALRVVLKPSPAYADEV
ncbi:hypothetical protein LCGC14_1847850 [marine sediment metagenome]|uniref:Uncharacterized protein n=1 Tax=marine sediment metagenome TaxID=412755 RepID=A0A0F9GZI2_9ZZZZ